ncbi:hypothetical protein [Thermogutta sp.]|uniref:hypothetical protein n=1 Tax=Thermogutta sp. TaxID=1962930 RepID=UPI003C7CDF6C
MAGEPTVKSVVVIHPYVDLDACACVAFAGVDVEQVEFLPSHITEPPASLATARFLDHPLGIKGTREDGGLVHAACLLMPEAADLVHSPLLREIDSQDTYGWSFARYNLATLITALRAEFKAQGMEGEELDRAILRCMVPIIRGLARLERQRRTKQVTLVKIGAWPFALRVDCENLDPHVSIQVVSEQEAEDLRPVGVLYQEGYNLGIARFAPFTDPDFRPLAPYLPGWFIHSSGFLACWGSNKAPRSEPPPAGTPQNWLELLQLVQKVLSDPAASAESDLPDT